LVRDEHGLGGFGAGNRGEYLAGEIYTNS